MPPLVALSLCVSFIIVLLHVERKRNPGASIALWVPTLWLMLCASKPIGRWFAIQGSASVGDPEAGSSIDRVVLIVLMTIAVLILNGRKIELSNILKDNFWLIVLLLYLGMSIVWSDFKFVSFKRWFRLAAAVPISLVILSERSPLNAMESVLRRCAYVLVPLSLMLIKYFPVYGVQYNYAGVKMWVGVASQKNSFGVICAIAIFTIIWSFGRELKEGGLFNRKNQTVSDGLVCGIAIFNLLGFRGTYSATAIGFLIGGIVTLVFLNKQKNYKRQWAAIIFIIVTTGLLSLTFFESLIPIATSAFNRRADFTGRDEIWQLVMEEASKKPVLGYGFGAYWYLQDEKIYSQTSVHEGHSGYLDVYLETGMVGCLFLLLFLLDTFKKSVRLINYSQFWGICGVCLIIMSVLHNYTESNYIRTSSYFWNIIVIISIIISSKRVHRLAT